MKLTMEFDLKKGIVWLLIGLIAGSNAGMFYSIIQFSQIQTSLGEADINKMVNIALNTAVIGDCEKLGLQTSCLPYNDDKGVMQYCQPVCIPIKETG